MNDRVLFFYNSFTSGLISGEDSLAGSHNLVSDIAELLLLLRSEERVSVRHLDSVEKEEDDKG